MSEVWFNSILSVMVVSLVSFVGIFTLTMRTKLLNRIIVYMISFSAGALFGDAFVHILPEIVSTNGFTIQISAALLSGVAVFFILEKIIHWRHCHQPTTKEHPHPFALMNLFGDGVHNFIDGLIIGSSYLVNVEVGIATTIAVVMHEIPQEIGDFGVLLHGGFSKSKALLLNFSISLIAVIGVVIAIVLSDYVSNVEMILMPFAAGGFIYIAGSDLIPEMHREVEVSKSIMQFFWFILGIALMFGLLAIA